MATLFIDHLMARFGAFKRVGRLLQVDAGVIPVLMRMTMMTGQLSAFSYWLLDI